MACTRLSRLDSESAMQVVSMVYKETKWKTNTKQDLKGESLLPKLQFQCVFLAILLSIHDSLFLVFTLILSIDRRYLSI